MLAEIFYYLSYEISDELRKNYLIFYKMFQFKKKNLRKQYVFFKKFFLIMQKNLRIFSTREDVNKISCCYKF